MPMFYSKYNLIREKSAKAVLSLARKSSYSDYMHYFGTDGIRAKASELLERKIPYYLGKALSKNNAKIIIARDVRTSSLDIEKMLCSGLLEGSARIWLCGILPTPALAFTALEQRADYAIMITASHNPPEFNGLKLFSRQGKKLSQEEELALDKQLYNLENESCTELAACSCADSLVENELQSELSITPGKQNHRICIVEGADFLYAKHIKELFPRLDGMRVRLDCAHGCYATLAPEIFTALGARVEALNDTRDGDRVNVDCGSTHIQALVAAMQKDEIGFAFDGDGDRVIAVADGRVYDGDGMLLALSALYRLRGKLKKRFIVGTVYTNTKLQRELVYQNIALLRTDVGDKHILDSLYANDCLLGGEKSGHIIMLDKASTGDGLITALSLLEVKKTLGRLPKFNPYPMLELNIYAQNPRLTLDSEDMQKRLTLINKRYPGSGRLIARPSGTEPYLRIAYECFASSYKKIFSDIQRILTEPQKAPLRNDTDKKP